jgi:hypothetical protein
MGWPKNSRLIKLSDGSYIEGNNRGKINRNRTPFSETEAIDLLLEIQYPKLSSSRAVGIDSREFAILHEIGAILRIDAARKREDDTPSYINAGSAIICDTLLNFPTDEIALQAISSMLSNRNGYDKELLEVLEGICIDSGLTAFTPQALLASAERIGEDFHDFQMPNPPKKYWAAGK